MQSFFFGSAQKQLMGIYMHAKAKQSLSHGILICPPIGHEYMRTHMALAQMATRLSTYGFDVLKFDYFGVGDSAGRSEDGEVSQWKTDIRTAYQELRDMSGVRNISIIGLRLGAALAAEALSEGLRLKHLVLWDPIINGNEYLQELRVLSTSLSPHDYSKVEDDIEVLVGFPFSKKSILSIGSIDLVTMNFNSKTNIFLFISRNKENYNALQVQLNALGCPLKVNKLILDNSINEKCSSLIETQSGMDPWSSLKEYDQVLICPQAINEISVYLRNHCVGESI